MKKSTIFFSLLSVLVTLSLLLTGACKGTGTTTNTGATGEQTLTVNLGGENNFLDPNQASWSTEVAILHQVYDGLLTFNPDLTLAPMVAKEIPTVANKGISADGKTLTIKLKTNVTWNDGTKVTAKDFVFSIKRLFDPNLACAYESFYSDVVGGDAYFNSASKTASEQSALKDAIGVRAVNDSTLEIKLIDPLPTFLQLLALWPIYPIREDMVTKYGDKWYQADANGAMPYYITDGPFIIQEWVQNDHYTLVRNEKYWGTKPTLTKIVFKELTDSNVAFAAYKNNEIDISGVPAGTEKTTMADATLSPQIVRYPQLVTYALQFNVLKPPFDNKLLRQAISCAIDRQAYIDQVRGGVGKVALSWIPPGMPGYDATLGTDWALNPTKAKDLLAQAGYPNGVGLPEIKFQYANTGTNPTLAAFLQQQLKTNLGVNLTLEAMDSKSFSALVNAKNHTWAFVGWGADYPDPDNWLPQLFGTGAGNNKTNYSNPAFDTLAATALKELDNTKRLQDWADAQKMVVADAPMVFLFNRETFQLCKPWVKGLTTTGMDSTIAGDSNFRLVYIQK